MASRFLKNTVFVAPVSVGTSGDRILLATGTRKGDLLVKVKGFPEVPFESFLAHTHGGRGWQLNVSLIKSLLPEPIVIPNQSRFPGAQWRKYPVSIGDVAGQTLYLLGVDVDGEPLVSRDGYFAVELYSLLKFAQATVDYKLPKNLLR
ncbi:hypothetical protein [Altericista sp. CCNU0014]|uniref:hypothetical protein n=1 Tax=Altericista sp. CCNU0014 TaxID=3082949 RepID=UPI00384F6B2B